MKRESIITSSFLGMYKRSTCPVCATPVSGLFALTGGHTPCSVCGEYLTTAGDKLVQVDETEVASQPAYAAPTPWEDMLCPLVGSVAFTAANALTDMLLTKQEGVRVLEARWPAGCCVCGKPAVREESIAANFTFTPPGLVRTDKKATVVARGIPHCAEHKAGAGFERVRFLDSEHQTIVGIFFRSYAYQIQFRKLNPWRWPK